MRMDGTEEEAAIEAVREVMRSKRLFRWEGVSGDPLEPSKVQQLERSFASAMGCDHALAVNSGTSALVCALAGLGAGPGDEVVVPAYTWFSTASSVLAVGAAPVVADVDDSLTLDPDAARGALSPYTKAIIAVHMRGAPASMNRLQELARERELSLLEDTAQAVGASFHGRRLGTIGDAGAYSFQLNKIITAGEGGMVVTNDPATNRRAVMYHDSASPTRSGISADEWLPGLNLRMTELQAAVLQVQLDRLDGILADMRARKTRLKDLIANTLGTHGVRFRTLHDPEGDAAIALILFLPDAQRAKRFVSALADDDVPSFPLYRDGDESGSRVDLHVYAGWAPLLRKRSWSTHGDPWDRHPRTIEYSQDACSRSVELLRRAVNIDISPDLTEQQVEQMAAGIIAAAEKVS
jgi:8-amino-3,8-dideoxy-alpha-D-manno-octulosonate transaminase